MADNIFLQFAVDKQACGDLYQTKKANFNRESEQNGKLNHVKKCLLLFKKLLVATSKLYLIPEQK